MYPPPHDLECTGYQRDQRTILFLDQQQVLRFPKAFLDTRAALSRYRRIASSQSYQEIFWLRVYRRLKCILAPVDWVLLELLAQDCLFCKQATLRAAHWQVQWTRRSVQTVVTQLTLVWISIRVHIKTVAVRNCVQITLIPMEIPVAATLDTSWLLMGRTAAISTNAPQIMEIVHKYAIILLEAISVHVVLATNLQQTTEPVLTSMNVLC